MGSRILTLQRQAAELGRLRTGFYDSGRPQRSETWILTSHEREYAQAAADLWGGSVHEWKPLNGSIKQWRVITNAVSLDAILPSGDPLNQYNEMWSGGGCQRRCDGITEKLSRKPCICLAQHGEDWYLLPKGKVCSATTRLNVLLPDMPDLGVWRAETKSFYAADGMAGQVDTVLQGTGGQGIVPVRLTIQQRQVVRNGKTKHFPVVMVIPRLTQLRQALAGPLSTAVALNPGASSEALAIEAPKPDYIALAKGSLTSDDVRDLWRQARQAAHVQQDGKDPLSRELMSIAALKDEEAAAEAPSHPVADAEGVVDAEIVDENALLWSDILDAADDKHGWTKEQTEREFLKGSEGVPVAMATVATLEAFLTHLTGGAQ